MSTPAHAPLRSTERRFYVAAAVMTALVVFIGFSRTYFLNSFFTNRVLTPKLYVHGFLFTSWVVMFIAQVSLVAARRTDIHRKLGWVGAGLAVCMIVAGMAVAIESAQLGHAPAGIPPLQFLIIPVGDMVMFAGLVGAAVYFRRQPADHKRLMLLATFVMLPAAFARFPFAFIEQGGPAVFYGVPDLVLIGCLVYDRMKHGRMNRAFLIGSVVLILSHPLRIVFSGRSAWQNFAAWLVQ